MTVIRVIDFETTGTEPPHQVIELGYSDYDVETKAITDPVSELFFVDAIPPESRAVHHIRLSDIPDTAHPYDAFGDVRMPAETMAIKFIAAHNAKFEAQWLDLEGFYLICTYKAALRMWPDAPSFGNNALFYWLEDAGKVSANLAMTMPPHRAGPDAYVTAHLLKALFEAGATGRDMVGWTMEPALLPRCPIGEWSGKPWSEVDGGFLGWIVRKVGMDADMKWNAQREIDRRASL